MTPTPDLFPSRSHTEAVDAITAALQGGASCVLVVGVSGIGKTSLCRELSGSTDERTFFTALLDSRLSVEDVLGQLLSDFGLLASPSAGGSDRERLRSAVTRFLVSLKPLGARAVVVVDDADRVGSDVLGTLHRLAVDDETQGQLRLVLVGQPSLEARLREPAFTELDALIAHRVRLTPLDRDELLPYVAHRADHGAADAAGGVLTAERLSQVFDQSEGIPARVNFFAARPAQADGEP
ncbi:MAG: AAA family ATPase, partial [Vicinamibacterales bacterium]